MMSGNAKAIDLRHSLVALRDSALDQLVVGGVNPGSLAILSSTTAALDALDRMPAPSAAARFLVADDGDNIRVILAGPRGKLADCPLSATAALNLAAELIKAAAMHDQINEERE